MTKNTRTLIVTVVYVLARTVFCVLLALVLVRLLYTTRAGIAVVDSIPDEVFDWFQGLWSESSSNSVEDAQNIDALLVFVLCMLVSATMVYGLERARERISRPRGY